MKWQKKAEKTLNKRILKAEDRKSLFTNFASRSLQPLFILFFFSQWPALGLAARKGLKINRDGHCFTNIETSQTLLQTLPLGLNTLVKCLGCFSIGKTMTCVLYLPS